MYKVDFRKPASKELKNLPTKEITRIILMAEVLSENPRPPGSKKLEGSNENMWRVRVGVYRMVYAIDEQLKTIEVRRVRHRKDVYK